MHKPELVVPFESCILVYEYHFFFKPMNLSYRIWFSMRTGSSLLCQALSDTGIAGRPGEHLQLMGADEPDLCAKYGVSTYPELRDKLWQIGSTPNGVFGSKYAMRHWHHQILHTELARLQGIDETSEDAVWADLLPNEKHIFLTRRDKLRQTISWWKAIQDNVWHLRDGELRQQKETFYADKYDLDALKALIQETILMEAQTQAWFDARQIVPLHITYEDLVSDFSGQIKRILDFLELDHQGIQIPAPALRRTANAHTEKWLQRLKDDLQPDIAKRVYL